MSTKQERINDSIALAQRQVVRIWNMAAEVSEDDLRHRIRALASTIDDELENIKREVS